MLKLNIQRFADGEVILGIDLDTKSFDKQIKEVEYELEQIDFDLQHAKQLKLDTRTINEYEAKAEKLRNKLKDLNDKQEEINNSNMGNASNNLAKIGNSVESVIQKVKRWALAIFGIRSAYSAVRSAMSIITQYDKQMGSDVEYIRYLLASTLKPIIETIINLVYKMLAYINYIAKAWFGVNLFANASYKAFKKVNSGIKNTNKSAKELQKTLTGFDEMNILQKDGSTAVGGGGGGFTPPSITDLNKIDIPNWVKWIADNKDTIIQAIKEIGEIFIASLIIKKFLDWSNAIAQLKDNLGKLIPKLENMGGLKIFGIIGGVVIALSGIFDIVKALPEFIADPSWETFSRVLEGIFKIIGGIGLILVSMNLKSVPGWIMLIVGAVGFLITKLSENKTEAEELKEAQDRLNKSQQEYIDASKKQLSAFKDLKRAKKRLREAGEKLGLSEEETRKKGEKLFQSIKDGKTDVDDLKGKNLELYEAYLDVIDSQKKMKKANDEVHDAHVQEVNDNLDVQEKLAKTSNDYEKYGENIIKAYKEGVIPTVEEASSKLQYVLGKLDEKSKETFMEKIPKDIDNFRKKMAEKLKFESPIKIGVEINKQNAVKQAQKIIDTLKAMFKKISIPLNDFFSGNTSSKTKTKKKAKGGIVGYAKGGILGTRLPKLASGAVINQPGRGVPLAIGGEIGREGVIPLTDSQQMALLGEAIGKYITVNANITNTMNGRVISKELKRVQNEQDFAYNR